MLLATITKLVSVIQANMLARLPGLTFKTGARFIQSNTGGNRVVFFPISDRFEPGRQQQGVRRVTRVRVVQMQAYLWGVTTKPDNTIYRRGEALDVGAGGRDSMGQVDAMLNALLCALEDSCKAVQYDLEDGAWEDRGEGDSVSEYGLGYYLTFTVRVPVVYDPLVETPVTGHAIGYTLPDDSVVTPPP